MEKQTLGHQQKYVTKDERVENLWKKLIGRKQTYPKKPSHGWHDEFYN